MGSGTKAPSTARHPVQSAALGSVPHVNGRVPSTAEDDEPNREDEGLEFRLFASTTDGTVASVKPEEGHDASTRRTSATSRVQRIRIRSPTPHSNTEGGGGFVNPHRRREYYFTFEEADDTSNKKKQQYGSVAINGVEVDQLAALRWVRWVLCQLHSIQTADCPLLLVVWFCSTMASTPHPILVTPTSTK